MRIKQKYIKNIKPEVIWTHGKAVMELRKEPVLNVNVITAKESQCYQISRAHYDSLVAQSQRDTDKDYLRNRCREAIKKQQEYKDDRDLRDFYEAAYIGFRDRLYACSKYNKETGFYE